MLMSYTADIRSASYPICYETGDIEALKKLAYERFEPVSRFVQGKRFAVGDDLTFVDFFLYEQVEMFDYFCEEGGLKKKYPALAEHGARVAELPGVKEYLASHRCIKNLFNGKRAKINKH